ncbi:hypothetical protein ACFLZL_04945 [Thermodesulfobacteriota bacterium]
MPFTTVPGLPGKVYVPEMESGTERKHHCKDCFSCQVCSDDRCNLCMEVEPCHCRKSSIRTDTAAKGNNDI